MKRNLKLKLELVPKPLWGINLRSKQGLGKNRWDNLRKRIIASGQTTCAICGGTERLHGHEVWEYRDRPRVSIAKLLRVEMVCRKCHDVNHWGNTVRLIAEGKITKAGYLALRKHFRTVNGCKQKDFDSHLNASLTIYAKRSSKKWRVDWGDFAPALADAKAARDAWANRNSFHPSQDDSFSVGPGHHMPGRCPQCRAVGTLRLIEADAEEMTDGQAADHEAGVSGFAFFNACKSNVFWEM